MSLRQQLKATVARCTPLPMQHATFDQDRATDDATGVQQPAANPHEYWVSDATSDATGVQLESCMGATEGEKLHVAFAKACNTQLGLTAQRQVRELIAAAMRCCDSFNDGPEARAQMVRDMEATPPELREDLLDYFTRKYPTKDIQR